LCLIHKYILYGPPPSESARDILVALYEAWAGNIVMKGKDSNDEYRSDYFSKLI
jgi:hypothetical protein